MRRRLIIGGSVFGGLLLIALLSLWLSYGRIGEWVIRDKVLPKIEKRLGQPLVIGEIDVGRGSVTLANVSLAGDKVPLAGEQAPLLTIDRIVVHYDYGASWLGKVVVNEVEIYGLQVQVHRFADGHSNVSALLDRIHPKKNSEGKKGTSSLGRMKPNLISVHGGEIHVIDEQKGHVLHGVGIEAKAEPKEQGQGELHFSSLKIQPNQGPVLRLGASVLRVAMDKPLESARFEVQDGDVLLWKGMRLTGITGQMAPGDDLGALIVDLKGSYGGSSEELWQASGWVEPKAKRGQLAVRAERFTLDRISTVLKTSILRDYENTSVDAELLVDIEDGKAEVAGTLAISKLNFFYPRLSEQVVRDLSFQGELNASLDLAAKTMQIVDMTLISKGVSYKLAGRAALAGGLQEDGSVREFPMIDLRAQVPSADCQAVLESIPAEIVPKLQGFSLRGVFSADMKLRIDWGDLEATQLLGYVGLAKCSVLHPASEFNTERLMNGFEHQTLVGPNQFESVEIGMASPNYAQLFDISPYFLNAVLTHEDSRFYSHRGFITKEFTAALIRNLQAGSFKRGASSITMQMVKNVFLYRDKTISRKLQELFLTWYVEKTLDKNRILEIYVNAIEYGPGIYGIVKASRTYFDKHPRDIDPVEAAFLGQLLPAPRRRYFEYCKDKLGRRTTAKMGRLLANMNKRGRLTDEELAEAADLEIEFNPVKDRVLCKRIPSW